MQYNSYEDQYDTKVCQVSGIIKDNLKIYYKDCKTAIDLVYLVQNLMAEYGYKPAFPTLILPDELVSNITPLNTDRTELNYQLCTVDFGILNHKGEIIDTALTLTTPKYHGHLKAYRLKIFEIQTDLQKILDTQGYILYRQLAQTVSKRMAQLPFKNYIVPQCGAHTIAPYSLHKDFLPMSVDAINLVSEKYLNRKLVPGTRFTIEPHLLILPEDLKEEPEFIYKESNIVQDRFHNYDSTDKRLNSIKDESSMTSVIGQKANTLAFYEQNTYIINNSYKIVRVS